MAALPTPCGLPGCWRLVEQPEGRGRPRTYCSDDHRRQADHMRKRTVARLTALREQIRRDEHLLAALGGDDEVSDALILARVTRMSDGRSSFVLCGNEGLDTVIRTGLIECGRQVNEGGWCDVEEDDE